MSEDDDTIIHIQQSVWDRIRFDLTRRAVEAALSSLDQATVLAPDFDHMSAYVTGAAVVEDAARMLARFLRGRTGDEYDLVRMALDKLVGAGSLLPEVPPLDAASDEKFKRR